VPEPAWKYQTGSRRFSVQ